MAGSENADRLRRGMSLYMAQNDVEWPLKVNCYSLMSSVSVYLGMDSSLRDTEYSTSRQI